MSGVLEFTILGCGSSGGVPRADGDWGDCNPANPKNRRFRSRAKIQRSTISTAPSTLPLSRGRRLRVGNIVVS